MGVTPASTLADLSRRLHFTPLEVWAGREARLINKAWKKPADLKSVTAYRWAIPGAPPSTNARFGPAFYYADNANAVRGYEEYRPGGRLVRTTLDYLRPFNARYPDEKTPEWRRFVKILRRLGVTAPMLRFYSWEQKAADTFHALRIMLDEQDIAEAEDEFAFWPRSIPLNRMLREAGYDIIIFTSSDMGLGMGVSGTEYALLRDTAPPETPIP